MGVYSNLEASFDYDIIEEFLNHYSFMTDALENLIIKLEDPEYYPNNINEIFRIFHNIKSASGYLKLTNINKIVLLGEEVLEECRELEGAASDELINWLLRISDQLNLYRKDIENDVEEFSPLDHNIIKIPTHYLR